MPSWGSVLREIEGQTPLESSVDRVRRKYLAQLNKLTKRNTIAYYSGWLRNPTLFGVDINDMDINALMTTIHKMDCSKGLDLILHTPGGGISATEQIVYYLKEKFGTNIRAIVPQIAMSAGTMIACACESIIMGKQSALGPLDPQVAGVSAPRIQLEFEEAIRQVTQNPQSAPVWQMIIGKYHPTFLQQCKLATDRTSKLVSSWLRENMFKDDDACYLKSDHIVQQLTDLGKDEEHARHISITEAKKYGLKIIDLEDDQKLQDLVLTVHHAFMHTFSMTPNLVKVVENDKGIGMFNFG